ncbi:MAG: hypothetical protein BWZ10_01597 [candidate division BRC1 bacterium ADurb.BinA364]|nr:MAG: hypothetical protein BWZ10_01597 [candidate division BRC1 bacterium ADurb.BinA364]
MGQHSLFKTNLFRGQAQNVVKKIVSDFVSPEGKPAAAVDGARVIALQQNMVDFVELDDVIVAEEVDGGVGRVVNQVVSGAIAYSGQSDGRSVGFPKARKAHYFVVHDRMPPGCERGAVAACGADGVGPGVVDDAAANRVPLAIVDCNGLSAQIADVALLDRHAFAAFDLQGAPPCRAQCQVAQNDMGSIAHPHQRLRAKRQRRRSLPVPFRRIEIKDSCLAIEMPFSRSVQLLQQIEGKEPLVFAHAVAAGMFGPDHAGLRIDGPNPRALVGPIVIPISI